MKQHLPQKALFFFLFLSLGFSLRAQDFVWRKGSGLTDIAGAYGTLGVPAATNTPGSRESSMSWRDNAGNLWLFGGYGYDAAGAYGFLTIYGNLTPIPMSGPA